MKKSRNNLFTYFLLGLCGVLVLVSCHTEQRKEQLQEEYKTRGIVITDSLQGVLMHNVGKQIKACGLLQPLSFCNRKALPLTGSLSESYGVTVQRLAEKNRNPINALTTSLDKEVWEQIEDSPEGLITQDSEGSYVYYRPITIAMASCLQCHGKKEALLPSVRDALSFYYPADKAIDFKHEDLRGMWKVSFE